MPPKRKRDIAESPDADLDVHPLTQENLQLHQDQYTPPQMPPKLAKSTNSGSTTTSSIAGQRERNEAAHIYWDTNVPVPLPLEAHVKVLQTRRRITSPKAEEIKNKAKSARRGGESDARREMENLLLLKRDGEGAHDFLEALCDVHLNSKFNPPIVHPVYIEQGVKDIQQAQPDSCLGYLPRMQRAPTEAVAFSREQEISLARGYI